MRLFEGLRIEVLYLAVQGFGFRGYYTGLKYYKFCSTSDNYMLLGLEGPRLFGLECLRFMVCGGLKV